MVRSVLFENSCAFLFLFLMGFCSASCSPEKECVQARQHCRPAYGVAISRLYKGRILLEPKGKVQQDVYLAATHIGLYRDHQRMLPPSAI